VKLFIWDDSIIVVADTMREARELLANVSGIVRILDGLLRIALRLNLIFLACAYYLRSIIW
jgi:hypothetical protein